MTYGVPASPNLCRGIAGNENAKRVLELNRLVILPEHYGKNTASFLVSHSLKMLREKYGHIFIVSYADYEGWGHVGYVYQATNFLYTGMTKSRTDKKPINGGHSRHYAKGETQRVYRTAKHRYVFLVGDRSDRKKMMKDLRYKTYAYPKGDTHRYDTENPISLLNN